MTECMKCFMSVSKKYSGMFAKSQKSYVVNIGLPQTCT